MPEPKVKSAKDLKNVISDMVSQKIKTKTVKYAFDKKTYSFIILDLAHGCSSVKISLPSIKDGVFGEYPCVKMSWNTYFKSVNLEDYYFYKGIGIIQPGFQCQPISNVDFFRFLREMTETDATLHDVSFKTINGVKISMPLFVLAGERSFYDKVSSFKNTIFYETLAAVSKKTLHELMEQCIKVRHANIQKRALKRNALEEETRKKIVQMEKDARKNYDAVLDSLKKIMEAPDTATLQEIAKRCILMCKQNVDIFAVNKAVTLLSYDFLDCFGESPNFTYNRKTHPYYGKFLMPSGFSKATRFAKTPVCLYAKKSKRKVR
jgi:hypothetical protein